MNRFRRIILCLTLCMVLLPAVAFAKTVTFEGNDYTIDEINFTAALTRAVVKTNSRIDIPDTIHVDDKTYSVTSIKTGAVNDSTTRSNVNVYIGANVERIEKDAFQSLKSVTMIAFASDKCQTIDRDAFSGLAKGSFFTLQIYSKDKERQHG